MSADLPQAALALNQNADGSWGYLADGPGMPEPTLLAIAAGAPSERAIDWLANADLSWTRLLLPAALHGHGPAAETLSEDAIAFLIEARGEIVERDPELHGWDTELDAWSWVPRTAPWVEPTAYAVLSLRCTGRSDHPRAQAGAAMLVDRQCSDGGWNYGNPAVLGQELESYLPPTGWATLALPPSPAVDRALARLLDARSQASTTTLSLAILARAAHGAPLLDLPDRLAARAGPDGLFDGRLDRIALAVCALKVAAGEPHPFAPATS